MKQSFIIKDRRWWQVLAVMLVISLFGLQLSAQVITAPKIYFPLSNASKVTTSPARYNSTSPGLVTNISAVINNSVTSTAIANRFGTNNEAFSVSTDTNVRLQIANAAGSNTSTSFFGTNATTGFDVDKLTISCWVYVNPTETTKRYLFYGTDSSNKLGFGLSVQGADLYLSKYINNATAEKGNALPDPTITQIGNTWEGKFWGPATFNAGIGWYQVILVQADYYTRVFVGMPPNSSLTDGKGKIGRFNKDFTGSMVMHGKQDLKLFTKWGMGAPEGNTTAAPVQRIDDFMLFDYDMTPAEAEALYRCQVDNTVETCLGSSVTYTQTFAFIADYGCDGGHQVAGDTRTPYLNNPVEKVANMVKSWNPAFIVTGGDDNYPDSQSHGCSENIDNNVGKHYRDYIYPYTSNNGYTRTAGSPNTNRYFPVMGNHDDNCPPSLNFPTNSCRFIWENYFPTENQTINTGNAGRYYTFTQGNIQFFAINSNKEEPDGNTYNSTQANWIKQQMQASTATFKIVYMHHPPYFSVATGSHAGAGNSTTMSKWPLKEWGADLVIAGDNHWYERSDSADLTFVTCGVGGYTGLAAAQKIVTGNRVHIEGEYGAMRIESNDNTMRFRFYSIDPTDPNNRSKDRLRDEFYLRKRVGGSTYLVENPVELVSKKETLEEAITAYPNPTNGELNIRIQSTTEGLATFKIFNLSDKLIYTQQESLTKGIQELNIGNLKSKGVATGVYFLQVNTPDQIHTVKIIIQ